LNLAYKFSTQTQKTLPQVLKTDTHLEGLFDQASVEMDALKKSRGKTKKPFKVHLVDRTATKKRGKGKESKKVCYSPNILTS
jgi:hypothetical protein